MEQTMAFMPDNFCEVDGGFIWMTLLGDVPCWFGRGPTGYLLGPFSSSENCEMAVADDVAWDKSGELSRALTSPPLDDLRPRDTRRLDLALLDLPAVMLWRIDLRGGLHINVAVDDKGVVERASYTDEGCPSDTEGRVVLNASGPKTTHR